MVPVPLHRGRARGSAVSDRSRSRLFPAELENTCPLPTTSTFSFASLLNHRNIWKNLLILGFTK